MTQQHWIERAHKVLPGGGFGNFDPGIIIRHGKGSRVWDEDGNEYIDYLIGSGPMLLGHGNEEVLDAVKQQLGQGLTFFANNARGIELAEEIIRAVPCAEQVRYVASGGEADMYAMRAARAFSGREKIMKFEGGYHGMSAEAQMSLAPSELVDFPAAVPDSAGIPRCVREQMIIAPYNDLELARSLMQQYRDELAALIVEPLQRIIPPQPGFLQGLRALCDEFGVLLIFDEIVTGFRLAYGGAQELHGVTPDLCTLGKITGGGFPLAAIAGRADIMLHFDKSQVGAEGFLMQLGTLSGNPVASVAGLKTMEILRRPGQYQKLIDIGEQLMAMYRGHLDRTGHPYQMVGHPTLFDVVFTADPVVDYRDALKGDSARAVAFNKTLRAQGIFKSPAKLYASLAISDLDLERTDAAIKAAADGLS